MKTVAEFTKRAVGKYLQSAVFIDDEIFAKFSGKPLEDKTVSLRIRKPTILVGHEVSAPLVVKAEPVEVQAQFHPRELVASFAQRGIVCALYEPEPEFKTDEGSEVFKLCEAADLVILDWDFFKDDGAKMRELVTALVAQGSKTIPHHSRLLVVYTTALSLLKVSSAIFDSLKSMDPKPSDGPLRLDVGPTRIVVLGKIGIQRQSDEVHFTVAEKDFADRVLKEFVGKYEGILSSCALLAMAAVKRNSRRILGKFGAEMDGAFLLHRALLLHNEEAFEMLPTLIAEEFLAVVEDDFADIGDLTDVVQEKVASMTVRVPARAWIMDTGNVNENGNRVCRALSTEEFTCLVRGLLNKGVQGLKAYRKCMEVKKLSENGRSFARGQDASIIGALRGAVDADGVHTNERLAALFNARTFYDQQARFLTLGTIVRFVEGERSDYRLCLVPVCDAVRLRAERSYEFPFLRLASGISGRSGGNGFVVEEFRQQPVELVASAKVRELSIERFTPRGAAGVIVAERDGDRFWLTADGGRRSEWVGQLKPAHAQRVAHGIGQALSRVGLSEAEWVRIVCDRE